ncbi:hypothetical protein [Paenibacillus lupini]|nr:hypothetical protein [Paenibacillus lupini]NIK22906.1 hypothetical protein [Paenibacillus lupini]
MKAFGWFLGTLNTAMVDYMSGLAFSISGLYDGVVIGGGAMAG